YRSGAGPDAGSAPLDEADARDVAAFVSALDGSRGSFCHVADEATVAMTTRANGFIQQSAPWTLAKDPARAADLDTVLAALVRSLARLAVLHAALMPGKAEALWRQLGA